MATHSHDHYVVGLFDNRADAEAVEREIKAADIKHHKIDKTHHGPARDLVGKLRDHGVPEQHAHYYAEGVRRGGHLVSVQTDDDHSGDALRIMREHGAVDINKRASYYRKGGFNRYDENATPFTEQEAAADRDRFHQEKAKLPVIEEEVHVGKERQETGGVRVFRHETERPVEKDVHLHEEHVDVNRKKVDRPATERDRAALHEGDITIRESKERPVVSKEAKVTEEVEVTKRREDRTEHVKDTAKKQDVKVERTDEHRRR